MSFWDRSKLGSVWCNVRVLCRCIGLSEHGVSTRRLLSMHIHIQFTYMSVRITNVSFQVKAACLSYYKRLQRSRYTHVQMLIKGFNVHDTWHSRHEYDALDCRRRFIVLISQQNIFHLLNSHLSVRISNVSHFKSQLFLHVFYNSLWWSVRRLLERFVKRISYFFLHIPRICASTSWRMSEVSSVKKTIAALGEIFEK